MAQCCLFLVWVLNLVCHLRVEHRLGMSGVVVLEKLFGPRGKKQQGAEEECIMRSQVAFTAGQTLLG